MFVVNSVLINAAADAMWKWEQSGRTDKALHDAAEKKVAEYCERHQLPAWTGHLLFDTIQVTVRICNGFPPTPA